MTPSELVELRGQLTELLDAGLIQPSRAPYGAPVHIAKGDESKTTCVTRYGSYEFLVMPFRLTNAPATFCNLMNDVLFDFLDSFVVVYLDDIVIYSQTLQDHLVHLEKALGVQGTNMHGWIQGGSNPGLAYTYKGN
ncbi:RNA-directed DNA polymerase-like [Vitis vinifera]|uniref:RNA-directed DNA polymerase-like n=1 Tax=Vitis vinifera TaxID=29760 RepID=A0A438DT20_VITVI|nr:RNA-directed DNA polymerase-like [Vitis vinifera]